MFLNLFLVFFNLFFLTSKLSSSKDATPCPGQVQAGIARRQQEQTHLQKKGLAVHREAGLGYLSSGPQTISFTSTFHLLSSNKAFLYLQAASLPF